MSRQAAPPWYRHALDVLHGGAAHAHWWTHVAAQFAGTYRVAALDLSGHGDSDRRDRYSLAAWTDEVMAVADAADMAGHPIVIGHSMGGFVTLATAARHPDRLAGAIVIDSPVVKADPEMDAGRRDNFRNPKVYLNAVTAVTRFRTVPEQDNYEPYVMADVAARSLRPCEGVVT